MKLGWIKACKLLLWSVNVVSLSTSTRCFIVYPDTEKGSAISPIWSNLDFFVLLNNFLVKFASVTSVKLDIYFVSVLRKHALSLHVPPCCFGSFVFVCNPRCSFSTKSTHMATWCAFTNVYTTILFRFSQFGNRPPAWELWYSSTYQRVAFNLRRITYIVICNETTTAARMYMMSPSPLTSCFYMDYPPSKQFPWFLVTFLQDNSPCPLPKDPFTTFVASTTNPPVFISKMTVNGQVTYLWNTTSAQMFYNYYWDDVSSRVPVAGISTLLTSDSHIVADDQLTFFDVWETKVDPAVFNVTMPCFPQVYLDQLLRQESENAMEAFNWFHFLNR